MKKSSYYTFGLILLILLAFAVGVLEGRGQIIKEEIENYPDKEFSVIYKNGKEKANVRYRYELSFATAKNFDKDGWYDDEILFSLNNGNKEVANTTLNNENKTIIPEVSETIILKPNEKMKENFAIIPSEKLKANEDLVRFETKVIIEELRDKRWTPVYQAVFMKRGDYWSLNKGPVELLQE